MKEVFVPPKGPSWPDHMSHFFLGDMPNPMRLFAKIILTNMWHINRHIDISLDQVCFIYVLIKGHSVDLPSLIKGIIIIFPMGASLLSFHIYARFLFVPLSLPCLHWR
jgi:hypothetical protein